MDGRGNLMFIPCQPARRVSGGPPPPDDVGGPVRLVSVMLLLHKSRRRRRRPLVRHACCCCLVAQWLWTTPDMQWLPSASPPPSPLLPAGLAAVMTTFPRPLPHNPSRLNQNCGGTMSRRRPVAPPISTPRHTLTHLRAPACRPVVRPPHRSARIKSGPALPALPRPGLLP